MKRMMLVWVMILYLILVQSIGVAETPQYHPVEPVGTVPEAYAEIVQQNLLGNVRFIEGGLFTYNGIGNGKTVFKRIDSKGRTLASCEIECGELMVAVMSGTSDGGFLIALGFVDREVERGVWLSDSGVVSGVVKCAEDGTVEWTCELPDVQERMLQACFETESGYVFFGDRENPKTKRRGVASITDLSCLTISKTGEFISLHTIGGSDFDMFHRAEKSVIGYTLYAMVQSQDGDFAEFGGRGRFASGLTLRIDVDADFNILGMRESDRQVGYADRIGTVDGQLVMWYSREQPGLSLLRNFDAGTPRLVLDEGETVLVISRNITGVYENTPPYISSIWHYYETVYSAYTKDGRLLWRAAVDSSPDYDARMQIMQGR